MTEPKHTPGPVCHDLLAEVEKLRLELGLKGDGTRIDIPGTLKERDDARTENEALRATVAAYRNSNIRYYNTIASMREALEAVRPVLWAAVGEGMTREMHERCVQAHTQAVAALDNTLAVEATKETVRGPAKGFRGWPPDA